MKHTLFILALITATIQTFAQSPRIKLNQITKDSLTGSVLISSPTDSGMVYSRDLFISYGADTVLILGGDTLAATSSIISSVLSDGVTITGNGTTGSELTVDTATVIATKQDLDLYYLDSNPDGYTSNTGTVTSVGGTGTVNGISLSGTVTSTGNLTLGGTLSGVDLASQVTGTLPVANGGTGSDTTNFVDLSSAQTVGGAKTFTSALTQSGGDVNFDSATFFVDADLDRVGIGTTNLDNELNISSTTVPVLRLNSQTTNGNVYLLNSADIFGDRASLFVNAYFNGITFVKTFNNFPIWALQMRTYEDDFVLLRSDTGSVVSFSTLFKIEKDGGIFAPSLGAAAGTYPVEYNTSTKELTYDNTSSIRFKDNIRPFTKGLNELLQLNPVSYEYKETGFTAHGFIAEQVLDSNLEEIVTFSNEGLVQGLRRKFFFPLIVQSIQEQQAIIESQATEIEQLKSQIQLILSEIEQIKNN